jgi:hypothetical protein
VDPVFKVKLKFAVNPLMADYYEPLESKPRLPGMPLVIKRLSFETFLLVLGALLEEKSIMFHCRDLKFAFAAVRFFISLLKPLAWPYPLVPMVSPKNYELMRSPFPILGCVKDDILFVMNTWNSATEPNLVHIDLDNNFHSGCPKYRLDKVYRGTKALETMKRDFDLLHRSLNPDWPVSMESVPGFHAIELVNLVSQMIGELFWAGRNVLKGVAKKREHVVQNSAIDKAAQKTYAMTQMFNSLHANS